MFCRSNHSLLQQFSPRLSALLAGLTALSSLLSSLISLSSPQTITMLTRSLTTRKPGNAAAPSHSGKLASWHLTNCSTYRWRRTLQVLEFLRSRTDLRGQRWSPVSTCTQHVTHTSHVSRGDKAVVTGHQESPEAAL